jgi:3-isopropylmalate/(R)-2-methylmalate dehydratase large subunit
VRARTLFEKIWESHVVSQENDAPAILYIDLHLIHEVTSPQAFSGLRAKGLRVRRPERTKATMDHSVPTLPRNKLAVLDAQGEAQLAQLAANCKEFGVELWAEGHDRQGIVHVVGPENGLTHPGSTIVCGDSHTATHGAFGALAFGIGTSEVEHVLATQCLLQRKPKSMAIEIDGRLPEGVTAKDLILAIIAKIGVGGATGHVIEYRGEAIRALSMEERMTVCNMSIEAGARAGMIAPDETTFAWLQGKAFAPAADVWERTLAKWKTYVTDDGARFDTVVRLDASTLTPMITFGTTPSMGIPIGDRIPDPANLADKSDRNALEKALTYMGFGANEPMLGKPVDVVFIGSCTNARLSDLRDAAKVFAGRKVAAGVKALVVPGSRAIKKAAESEGLDRIFLDAGAEWREPGCSMCLGMNGDNVDAGRVSVSTSNRNFEGRQGPGARTLLASPRTAAAAAVTGVVTDPRSLA